MSVLVEQQDETINTIEAQADTVQRDTEAGCVSTILLSFHLFYFLLDLVTQRRLLCQHELHVKSAGYVSSLSLSFSSSSVLWLVFWSSRTLTGAMLGSNTHYSGWMQHAIPSMSSRQNFVLLLNILRTLHVYNTFTTPAHTLLLRATDVKGGPLLDLHILIRSLLF